MDVAFDQHNHTSPDTEEIHDYHIHRKVVFIFVPVILYILGIPGNLLTIMVFRKRSMKDNFVSKLFVVLCVVNIFCLLVGLTRHFVEGLIDYNIRLYSTKVCYLHSYMTLVSISFSNWLLVVITAVRAIHIAKPERSSKGPSYFYAWSFLIFSSIAIAQGMFTTLGTWIFSDEETGALKECEITNGNVFAFFSMSVFAFIPAVLIAVLNVIISILHHRKVPTSMVQRKLNRLVKQQLYILILVTTCMFFITNIPLAVLYTSVSVLFDLTDPLEVQKAKLGMAYSAMLLYTGHAANFLTFCCFGSLFRRELKKSLAKSFPPLRALLFKRSETITNSGFVTDCNLRDDSLINYFREEGIFTPSVGSPDSLDKLESSTDV
ncbi:uncharacterized protein LOC131948920 isoform X2 [Physella acuta]|uniref:uncharacterized protein LOC131948920 isoform X2 n=1 Tax=Physella acuta TaxID=109671 RepID=UPI0027DC7DB8|nr:uncharacterized protein LOC131948920 isoform X2 [Physella acuta]